MDSLLRDGSKQITLSRAQFIDIGSVLALLHQKTKCLTAILADPSGLVISHQGSMESSNFAGLAAIAAANHAATAEVARLIGEPTEFETHLHQGQEKSVFLTGISGSFTLLVIFDKATTFGMVRVVSERLVSTLGEVLARKDEIGEDAVDISISETLSDDSFCEELSKELDAVLIAPSSPHEG